MAPNGTSVKFNDPGYNYAPQQIVPFVRFSYLIFPLFQSLSRCFHLGHFLFQEQIFLLFSYQFHFPFFQPLWKSKRHIHLEVTKANQDDTPNHLNVFVFKTTIYHGSVTRMPRMLPENRRFIRWKEAKHREETAREKIKREVVKCSFPLSFTWQLQLLNRYNFLNTMTDEVSSFFKKIFKV